MTDGSLYYELLTFNLAPFVVITWHNLASHVLLVNSFKHNVTDLAVLIHSPDPHHGRQGSLFLQMSSICPSIPAFQNLAKQNKAKAMFATGETVGLAKWIIDDTCLALTQISLRIWAQMKTKLISLWNMEKVSITQVHFIDNAYLPKSLYN